MPDSINGFAMKKKKKTNDKHEELLLRIILKQFFLDQNIFYQEEDIDEILQY